MNGYDNPDIALAGHGDRNGTRAGASYGLAEGDGRFADVDAGFADLDSVATGAEALAQGSHTVAGDAAAVVAMGLTEHYRCRRTVFEWMHPRRLARLPYAHCLSVDGSAALGETRRTAGTTALAEAFLDDAGIRVPPLASFAAPGAVLARLPVRECLTVFRLRALLDYSEAVHSWIDRPRRERLAEWIGPHGARLLLSRRRELAGDAVRGAPHAPLGADDGDALAWQGFRHFERECGWASDGPLAIMQLALPDDADGALVRAQPAAIEPTGQAWNLSLSIVSQLPDLFPEWSW